MSKDKSNLSCYGDFDGDYAQCIRCYDKGCMEETEKRWHEEDEEESEDKE